MHDYAFQLRCLPLLVICLACCGCGRSHRPVNDALVLRGQVKVFGIDQGGKALRERFELVLADDGRFREIIELDGAGTTNEMLFDGRTMWSRSFLAYPRTPILEVNEAEAEMWRSAFDSLREASEPARIEIVKQIPVDTDHSPVSRGVAPAQIATAVLTVDVQRIETAGGQHYPAAWSRSLVPFPVRGFRMVALKRLSGAAVGRRASPGG